jgi:hypothetical protein
MEITLLNGTDLLVVLIKLTVKQGILSLRPKRLAQLENYTSIMKNIQGQNISYSQNVTDGITASGGLSKEAVYGGGTKKAKFRFEVQNINIGSPKKATIPDSPGEGTTSPFAGECGEGVTSMSWGGGILYCLGKTLYRKSQMKNNVEKLEGGKADETEWIYGNIPTQCDSCLETLKRSFITGWDESIFKIMCPYCYEKVGSDLRDVKVYNLETLEIAKDEDTPEKRKESQRIKKMMGWG